MSDTIEAEAQYRQALKRTTALCDHASAIRGVQALASANRHIGHVEPEDLRDLAPLDDALADIAFTLKALEGDIADWEAFVNYGGPDDAAADRNWYRRRAL